MAFRDRVRAFLQAPQPAPQKGELAIADTRRGIAFVAGQQRTYNPDDLVGKKGLKIYDEMLHDEQVKACLTLKKCAVVGPGWTLEPWEKDAGQQELTDTLLDQLLLMDGNFSDALWEILSALEFGFSVSEKCYALEDDIVLRSLKTRAPHDIDFEQDPYGEISSIVQSQRSGLVHMPPQKFVHFVHNHGFSNPYGTSDLRASYRSWFAKRLLIQWWNIYMERYAIPTAKGMHPKNAPDAKVDAFLTALKTLQTNTCLTLEEGWEAELMESTRQPREIFETTVNRHDLAIAKGLLLPDKSGVVGGAVDAGSFALAKEQMGAFFYVLSTLARRLEDVVQEQLIDEVSELIAPGVPSPKFKLLPLTEDNKQQIVAAFTSLVTSGVILPGLEDENRARVLLGFEEVTPEQREEREAKKQEEQDKQFERQSALAAAKGFGKDDEGPPAAKKQEAKKKELSELPGRAQALKSNAVPTTFWRKLTKLEERTDMAEKRDTFEALTADLATTLGLQAQELVHELRADADMLDLARGVDALAIEALKVRPQRMTALAMALEQALASAYQRGTEEARAELQRAHTTMMAERDYVRHPKGSDEVTPSGDLAGGKFAPKGLTPTNRYVLTKTFAGGSRVPNGTIPPANAPHLRRLIKLGYVTVEGKDLVLTPAGQKILDEEQAGKNMSEPLTFAEPVGLIGRKASRFWRQKSLFVAGVFAEEVLKRAHQVLLSAVRQDKTERQVLWELGEALAEWLPEKDKAGRIVNVPARLETIARTNVGEAVSEARYATFTDPVLQGFVTAFRYSAILDDRVRETHRAWDGVVRPVDDGVWYTPDRRPLNGFSCRCLLSAVTIADEQEMTPDDELPLDVAGPDVFPDPGFK